MLTGRYLRTARRADAWSVDLRKTRRWFTDDPTDDELPDFSTLPPAVQEHIKGLRSEAKQSRLDKQEAVRKAQSLESQRAKDETARLERDKEFETLAQQRAARLEEVEPKAARLEQMEEQIRQRNTERIAAIPKNYQSLIPDFVLTADPLEVQKYLDKNEASFRVQTPPPTDAGVRGNSSNGSKSKVPMTAEYLTQSARAGLSTERAQVAWDRKYNS